MRSSVWSMGLCPDPTSDVTSLLALTHSSACFQLSNIFLSSSLALQARASQFRLSFKAANKFALTSLTSSCQEPRGYLVPSLAFFVVEMIDP